MQPDNQPAPRNDLTRITLTVLVIGALLAGSLAVLSAFLLPLVWATAITVAGWPLMLALEQRLRGRRWAAVLLISVFLLLLLVVPVTLAITTIAGHVDDIARIATQAVALVQGPPPAWLGGLPGGGAVAAKWQALAALTPAEVEAMVAPRVGTVGGWFIDQAGNIGLVVVEFLVTVLLCAILFMNGEDAARIVRRFAHRLAGVRGDNAVVLAAQAVRAVALGVVVTALVQATLAGIGLALAGIPLAGLLSAVTLLLCVAQVGVFPVLVPAVIWLFWSGDTGWGVFLLVWTLVVGMLDNVLRPWLIRRGADLPLLLILAGVIGGLLAFGIIGLFAGPVLLAVTWRLLEAWIDERHG